MPRADLRVWVSCEGELVRAVLDAGRMAREQGFDDVMATQLATALSELARNILKYAGEGEVCLRPVRSRGRAGLEIVAFDRGPGIADCDQAMCDHVSTGDSLGLGLPGVRRLMDEFELESEPGKGTRVTARKWL